MVSPGDEMASTDLCPFCLRPGCPGTFDECPRRSYVSFNDGRGHSGRFIAGNNEHASSSDICSAGIQACAPDCPVFDTARVSA